MIIFDASYLVIFLNENPEPAKDRQGNPVSRFKERVEYLAMELNASGEQIGIPAPAMAEVLVRVGAGRPKFVAILSDRMRFQIIPFDARAAIEAAELIALIRSKNEKWATHAKVKFDVQIVATAKAEDASVIYSDDADIENLAARVKIPVVRICDLRLPPPKEPPKIDTTPLGKQQQLFEDRAPVPQPEPTNLTFATVEVAANGPRNQQTQGIPAKGTEVSDKHETHTTPPAPVRGSDEGRAKGEAAGESKVAPTSGEAK